MEFSALVNKERTDNKSQRISFFEYLYVFVLVIYGGHAILHVASNSILGNPVWTTFPVILSGILALKWRLVFNKQFYVVVLCYSVYFFAISVKFNEFQLAYFINYLFFFFTVYVTVKALNVNFFRIYESVLYLLAILGMIFWGIQIVLGGDTLFSFFGMIPSIDSWSYVSGGGYNGIIYSVQPTSMSVQYDFLPPRNCGFAWEPGGFAVFLALAIFINLFFFNPDSTSKTRFWVMTSALVSSQSTTGYVIFIVIILFFYYNKKQKLVILLWPVLIVLIVLAFSLPFMSDKIVSLINEAEMVDIMVEGSIGRETSIAPQRFASFMIALRDFLANPVLGLGGNSQASWTAMIGANVSTITGLGNLLAQHGLVGLSFFLISLYRTSAFFSTAFNFKGKFLFFIIIILISISYTIILLPILMSLWMFKLFSPNGTQDRAIRIKGLSIKGRLALPAQTV